MKTRILIIASMLLFGCVVETNDDRPPICRNTLQHDIHRDICGNK